MELETCSVKFKPDVFEANAGSWANQMATATAMPKPCSPASKPQDDDSSGGADREQAPCAPEPPFHAPTAIPNLTEEDETGADQVRFSC